MVPLGYQDTFGFMLDHASTVNEGLYTNKHNWGWHGVATLHGLRWCMGRVKHGGAHQPKWRCPSCPPLSCWWGWHDPTFDEGSSTTLLAQHAKRSAWNSRINSLEHIFLVEMVIRACNVKLSGCNRGFCVIKSQFCITIWVLTSSLW